MELPTRFFASLKNDNVGNTAKDLGGMTNYRLSLRCMVVIACSAIDVGLPYLIVGVDVLGDPSFERAK